MLEPLKDEAEIKALIGNELWQEFVAQNRVKYEYLGFVSSHQEVALKITSIRPK